MCIICNCGDTGDEFLYADCKARHAMKEAADKMLRCSRETKTANQRRRYDRAHKRMVALIREWHKIEYERENVPDASE